MKFFGRKNIKRTIVSYIKIIRNVRLKVLLHRLRLLVG